MNTVATWMPLVRGLHLAATISLLGTVGFLVWMLPATVAVPALLHRRLIRLWWGSGIIAMVAGAAWFTLQAAAIAGSDSIPEALSALPLVAAHTRYGMAMMIRLGLLLVATGAAYLSVMAIGIPSHPVLPGEGPSHPVMAGEGPASTPVFRPSSTAKRLLPPILALVLTAVALGLQGMIGHAGATEGITGEGLVLSESLHLFAAGLWLGALLPLWLSVRALPPTGAAAICERFSPIGLACVLILAGTGFAQALQLIAGVPALFGTPYGHIALLKIALFLLALTLAAINRLGLTDRLAAQSPNARRVLLASVGIETSIGLALITAAAFMASSVPAAHSTPVWPFSWQFSLVTVTEDADFRQDVVVSLIAIGAAIVILAAALLRQRLRLIALAVLTLAVVVRGASLSLLTVPAYPTSFQTSPTGFAATAITRGQAVFNANCVACHGPNGDGHGPAGAALRIKPADLTLPHLWEHTDGEMFWWLTHGIDDPDGGVAMPGFGTVLSPDDRWALIDYVRAHNAGVAMQQETGFDGPVRAPAFPVTCNGIGASSMADLQGQPVHVVTSNAAEPSVSRRYAITLDLNDRDTPATGTCAAANQEARAAFAILEGAPPDALAGSDFLVDPNGWLRAVHRAGTPGGWPTADALIAAIAVIRAHPLKQLTEGHHDHHH